MAKHSLRARLNQSRETPYGGDLSYILLVSARPGVQIAWTVLLISTLIYSLTRTGEKNYLMISLLAGSFLFQIILHHFFPFDEYHPYLFFLIILTTLALVLSINYLTGGRESLLGLLYFIVPIYAGAYYSYPGTFISTLVTSIFRLIPFMSGKVTGVEWLTLSLSVFVFFTVGFLTCYVVEGEKQFARESEEFKQLLELSKDRERQLSLIYNLSRRFSHTLDLDNVIRLTISTARKMLSTQGACIFLLEKGMPVLKASLGTIPFSDISRITAPEGESWVIELSRGNGVVAEQISLDWLPLPEEEKNVKFDLVASPLHTGDRIEGMLLCFSPAGKGFRETHLDLLSTIASQASVALEKARLYSKTFEEKVKLETILNALRDGLILIDTNGEILEANPVAEKMLNIENIEETMNIVDILKNAIADFGKYNIVEAFRAATHGRTISGELSSRNNPTGTFQVYLIPLSDQTGNIVGVVVFLHDITELKKADEMKSNFISNVSHELRTPLTSITGYTSLLLAERAGSLTPQQQKFLNIIHEQSATLNELIEELLELSKVQAKKVSHKEEIDMENLIESTVEKFKQLANEKRIEIQVTFPEKLPFVAGSKKGIGQVLNNILENAIKFTREGGLVQISAIQNLPFIQVQISDNGIGISPSALPHIFDRFFQSSVEEQKEPKGFGLGLAISREIIEQNGGKIWAESAPGKGSAFYLTLPIYRGKNENLAE
ncbi:MAG: ATP-binding protein [Actinomycetota bacterium]|nr:ATP-binding protein [Actinomycetota bacterium]